MAMISVNGVVILTPSNYTCAIIENTVNNKTASGAVKLELISRKRTLELSYNFLSQSQLSTLMSALTVSDTRLAVTVIYPDILTGANRTSIFWATNRSASGIFMRDGIMYYKDIKFSLIEM